MRVNEAMQVWTIGEDGTPVRGAHINEVTTRRGDEIPTLNVGQQSDGRQSWLSYLKVELLPITDGLWNERQEVFIQNALLRPTEVPEFFKGQHAHERYEVCEVNARVTPDSDEVLVVCLLPIEVRGKGSVGEGDKIHARGRLLARVPSEDVDDGGKQIILTMKEGLPVTFDLHSGGTATYVWSRESGLLKIA